MAHRVLEVTLLSAKNLKMVNLFTRMEVYAVVTISGDPLTRQCTQPDPYGGRYPCWNATFRFDVPPTATAATGCLHVLLRTERALGDRDVGEVIVPLADILAGAAACDPGPRPPQCASYQVRKVHRCEPRGTLNVSYRLGPVVAPQAAPPARGNNEAGTVIAYPVPQPYYPLPYPYLPPSSSSPAPTNPYNYNLPSTYTQAPGHAAPPPAKGTGNDKLEFGMGLGVGLVGGAIGGMLAAGDMMSDVAAYNSGYRAGLAEGGAAKQKNSHVPQAHDNSGYRAGDHDNSGYRAAGLADGGVAKHKNSHAPQAHDNSGYRAAGLADGGVAMYKQNSHSSQAHDKGLTKVYSKRQDGVSY
ncbi:hypothetical protein ACP70R_004939 [Stipagrostis hirtigluma subsp. patula]